MKLLSISLPTEISQTIQHIYDFCMYTHVTSWLLCLTVAITTAIHNSQKMPLYYCLCAWLGRILSIVGNAPSMKYFHLQSSYSDPMHSVSCYNHQLYVCN